MILAQADSSTTNGPIGRLAKQLGLRSETPRTLASNYKNSAAITPARSIDLKAENKQLRAELAENKRANEILKKAATTFSV